MPEDLEEAVTGTIEPLSAREGLVPCARDVAVPLRNRLGHGRSLGLDAGRAPRERAEPVRAVERRSADREG